MKMAVDSFMPFRRAFEDAIKTGKKTATTRNRPYGEPGAVLSTEWGDIRLLSVEQWKLGDVKRELWREEGCVNAEHFESVWRSIHRGHWSADTVAWVHRFEFIG